MKLEVNTSELDRSGIVVLRNVLTQADITDFEAAISEFCASQLRKLKIKPEAADPFIDVFNRGGAYAHRVYKLLEKLFVLHRMSVDIAERLKSSGFFDWAGIKVGLVWPDIRADLPNQTDEVLSNQYGPLLPVHQDYGSTKCRAAWRLWIPLRPANIQRGSMLVYEGTHKRGPIAHNIENPLRPYVEPHHYAGIDPVILDLPAGDGALINPLVLHASVPNRSDSVKFTLMIQIQDMMTMADPDDEHDELAILERTVSARDRARTI
jgi:hypothetical protein